MSASSSGGSTAGVNIALAGLAFQVATLVIFIAAVVDYAILSRHIWRGANHTMRFRVFAISLSLATLLILIRCAYVSLRKYASLKGPRSLTYSSESTS